MIARKRVHATEKARRWLPPPAVATVSQVRRVYRPLSACAVYGGGGCGGGRGGGRGGRAAYETRRRVAGGLAPCWKRQHSLVLEACIPAIRGLRGRIARRPFVGMRVEGSQVNAEADTPRSREVRRGT